MLKSEGLATWMWIVVPFVLVAKAYQVLLTLMRPGSGKFAAMTGPATDLFSACCKRGDEEGCRVRGKALVRPSSNVHQNQPKRYIDRVMLEELITRILSQGGGAASRLYDVNRIVEEGS